MSDDEEKPPAPPLRLTSCSSGINLTPANFPVDMRPLPKEPEENALYSAGAKMAKKKNKKSKEDPKPNISYPTKFTHIMHVGFDPDTGEFTGMPESWTALLVASNISREMQLKNPQAVLDVLNYYEQSTQKGTSEKFMTQTQPSGSNSSLQKHISSSKYNDKGSKTPSPPPQLPPAPPIRRAGSSLSSTITPPSNQDDFVIVSRVEKASSGPSLPPKTEVGSEEFPPPPIATRPEKTKSIYTKPVDEDDTNDKALFVPDNLVKSNCEVQPVKSPNERPKKKKMSDEEILERLKSIVSVGDPNRKYTKMEKIGQGASGTVYTAIETSTGMEVAIKQV